MTIEDLLVSQGWVITDKKENYLIVQKELVRCKITYILGKPNIDILEDNKHAYFRRNIFTRSC